MRTMRDTEFEAAPPAFPLGLPIGRALWLRHGLDAVRAVATERGRPAALREVAQRAAEELSPAAGWRGGELAALDVISEVQRFLVDSYSRHQNPGCLARGLAFADAGADGVVSVRAGAVLHEDWVPTAPLAPPAVAREHIGLALLGENPAASAYSPLFRAPGLDDPAVKALVRSLEAWFEQQPALGGVGVSLFEALRAPFRAHPTSLQAQLGYIRERYGALLPAWLVDALELTSGVLAEESAFRGGGPGPALQLTFDARAADAPERFTPDRDWMANVVLLAKSAYVWLWQLSEEYGREVSRLDQIPDEELDRFAASGFTGLWLIGVWERSPASRTIKRWRGNHEALASAYSLYDYAIAGDLGGEAAWDELDRRCRARGIRLATDMVPNHTGLDSRWMLEHPEYFLQVDHPPFPGYRFTGEDLCQDPRLAVHIEDGYWAETDAAVVFKTFDHRDGRVRYVYHGNDGTSMPWNDTAQLDYLNPAVREAVIQKILDVARRSSIIRFDAAMTLAKQHIQRLWWPRPGHAGAIPSRAERAIPEAAFEAAMPHEFWREVVDRVQAELPDTLLLAEAFWLMEGFFVRTLGMHRVYNSAFMHMLRDEDNAKYRETLKNVLSFSAEVLQRFVNFMSNPDEATAAEQFGHGDKYFGVATLLATLPGLPMVGHGQVAGLAEKYGMEYARPSLDERPDEAFAAYHERRIFPLFHRRRLFSSCEQFALYDCVRPDAGVDEDVYAYSNGAGDARALVVYNNAYRMAEGWIHTSAPMRRGGSDAPLSQTTLADALGVGGSGLVALREHVRGEWILRHARELTDRGLHVHLGPYEARVYLELRLVPEDGAWSELARRLAGGGVHDLDRAYLLLVHEPARAAFLAMLTAPTFEANGDLEALVGAEAAARVAPSVAEAEELPKGDRTLGRALRLIAALGVEEARDMGVSEAAAELLAVPVAVLEVVATAPLSLPELFEAARGALGVNEHEGTLWYRQEAMDALVAALRVRWELDVGLDEADALVRRLVAAHRGADNRFHAFVAKAGVEAPPSEGPATPAPDTRL